MKSIQKNSLLKLMVALFLLAFIGCGSHKPIDDKSGHTHNDTHKKGEHVHEAPNGGSLVELGEEFAHLEFVNDTTNHKIICYVLDGSLKAGAKAQQASIMAEIKGHDGSQLIFKAIVNELASNTAESSSQFETEYNFEKSKKTTLIIKKVTIKNKTFENIEATLNETK